MCDRRTAGVQTPPLAVDDPKLKGLMSKVTMQKAQSAADTCYDVGDQAQPVTDQAQPVTEGYCGCSGEPPRTFATAGLLIVLGGLAASVFMMRRR